ncbi:ATP-binding cassette domain-containing protein [Saccharopolyspora taberi]|uniref:ATP-binding cassette domain-containing protein n=1 Tax=Saccharopolyspora taberi TaxID=60895 RepID=A0ABN3V8Y9_9PSEU
MIHARGLSRRFRDVDAVRELDIDITEGELVGFLGPNGAGKTTTIRMLTTLLPPTAGEATVAGCDLRTDPVGVRRRIGHVPQSGSAGADREVGDEIRMQARFHGLSAARARARCAELLGALGLDGLDRRPVAALSGGQRRRLDIALGLAHTPRLLFLDEPSTGLDPQSRAGLWELIRELRAEHGITVLLSTHYLDEADVLCDRLLVIDNGRIVATGTPDELKQRVSGDLVLFSCSDPETAATAVRGLPQARDVRFDADGVRFRTDRGDEALAALLRVVEPSRLTSLRVRRPSLDDVFLQLTGHRMEAADAA